ncbi:MAG: XrtA/PEP-CTERM system exopolysaccharide export protein [Pseudomonadota bacterium]
MHEENLLREYLIGVGDGLRINVWRNPDLSVDVTVLPDGKISVPLVGDLRAAGVNTEALAQNIADALEEFIKNPEVTVSVATADSAAYLQRVRITGAVQSPRSIPFRRGMTVLDMVLDAGGPTTFAATNRTVLYRRQEGSLVAYPIRLGDILKKGKVETNYALAPSDLISVPERSF